MIKINVATIKQQLTGEKKFSYTLTPEELEFAAEDLPFAGKIEVVGTLVNAGSMFLLRADVSAPMHRTCSRCLKDFTQLSNVSVTEKFYPAGNNGVESDAFVYDGDIVDVTEPLREGLIVSEPISFLCKEDCEGICPVCGADRNEHPCNCDTDTIDPRLSALKQFFKK